MLPPACSACVHERHARNVAAYLLPPQLLELVVVDGIPKVVEDSVVSKLRYLAFVFIRFAKNSASTTQVYIRCNSDRFSSEKKHRRVDSNIFVFFCLAPIDLTCPCSFLSQPLPTTPDPFVFLHGKSKNGVPTSGATSVTPQSLLARPVAGSKLRPRTRHLIRGDRKLSRGVTLTRQHLSPVLKRYSHSRGEVLLRLRCQGTFFVAG